MANANLAAAVESGLETTSNRNYPVTPRYNCNVTNGHLSWLTFFSKFYKTAIHTYFTVYTIYVCIYYVTVYTIYCHTFILHSYQY